MEHLIFHPEESQWIRNSRMFELAFIKWGADGSREVDFSCPYELFDEALELAAELFSAYPADAAGNEPRIDCYLYAFWKSVHELLRLEEEVKVGDALGSEGLRAYYRGLCDSRYVRWTLGRGAKIICREEWKDEQGFPREIADYLVTPSA